MFCFQTDRGVSVKYARTNASYNEQSPLQHTGIPVRSSICIRVPAPVQPGSALPARCSLRHARPDAGSDAQLRILRPSSAPARDYVRIRAATPADVRIRAGHAVQPDAHGHSHVPRIPTARATDAHVQLQHYEHDISGAPTGESVPAAEPRARVPPASQRADSCAETSE